MFGRTLSEGGETHEKGWKKNVSLKERYKAADEVFSARDRALT